MNFNKIQYIWDGTGLNRFRIKTFEKYLSLSENEVFKKQQFLLTRMLYYVVANCPYYQERRNSLDPSDLSTFPIINKKTVAKYFNDLCSAKVRTIPHGDGYTGGSTGEPLHILTSGGYEQEFGWRKWKTYGYRDGEVILAMDGAKVEQGALDRNEYLYRKSLVNDPGGSIGLSSLYLGKGNKKDYALAVYHSGASWIRGYPAFIYTVACTAEEEGVPLDKAGIRGIELTSETAYKYQIEKIQEVFRAPVYLQYGHTEACVFGYTWDQTFRYRVEPLYGYVEILNEEGFPAKEHEMGEVVVTTLHNRAFPLIRYRTGDYAVYGGKDERYLYLDTVMGRTQDYIINKNGEPVLLTALIFGQHCQAMSHITQWQIEQFEPGRIIVHVLRGELFSEKDEQELRHLFIEQGNVIPYFDYPEGIQLTPRGKSKMLVQHIHGNEME